MHKLRAFVAVVSVLSAMVATNVSAGASSGTVDAACALNGTLQFKPGLTTTPQATKVDVSQFVLGGTPSKCPLGGAGFIGHLHGDLYCKPGTYTLLGIAKGPLSVTWADDSTSDIHLSLKPVSTPRSGARVAVRGAVVAGTYAGDSLNGLIDLDASVGDGLSCRPGQGISSLSTQDNKPRTKPLTFSHL